MLLGISQFLKDLEKACLTDEVHLISTEISEAEGGAPFVAALTEIDFLSAVRLLRPKIIYFETVDFDAKIALLSKARIDYEELFEVDRHEKEEEEVDGEKALDSLAHIDRRNVGLYAAEKFINDNTTKLFLKNWENKNGSPFDLHLMFFANGVFHETKLIEDWYIDFENERDELLEQYRATYIEANDDVDARLDKETEEMAQKLARHPLFTAKGATKEKREYLAQQLFPTRQHRIYPQIVSRASSILWYESGGGH